MTSKKKYFLYVFIAISLCLNAMVLSLDTIPYLYPKIEQKYFPVKTMQITKDTDSQTRLIVQQGIEVVAKNHSVMVWNEPKGFTQEVIKRLTNKNQAEFRLNNYPRAFLYYGLTEYAVAKDDKAVLLEVKKQFDKFINSSQDINRVDQVPLGLAALNLYEIYHDIKYLDFADRLFKFVLSHLDEDGLVSYRKGQSSVLNDTLGMIVPFLLKYAPHTDFDTISMARDQLNYFVEYGISEKTYIPSHAINRIEGVQTGSINWGRGIGWYLMALAQFHKETGEYEEQYLGLIDTLSRLKNSEKLWSQFPGSTDKFDASTTTIFIYSMVINNPEMFNAMSVLNMLKNYISDEGSVLQTSGDTYAVNNYSHTFGESEMSQGILLLILSSLDK